MSIFHLFFLFLFSYFIPLLSTSSQPFIFCLKYVYVTDKTLTYASECWTLAKRDRKQLNIFERKVYRRILGPVYDSGKENWRILTNKQIYASVKKPTVIETIRLNKFRWFGHVQRMEGNRIHKRVLYMNLGTTRLRGRPRTR